MSATTPKWSDSFLSPSMLLTHAQGIKRQILAERDVVDGLTSVVGQVGGDDFQALTGKAIL